MLYTTPSHLSDMPIYKKALEIFSLSRKISHYLNNDLALLLSNGREDYNIYFSGDIVQQSVSLAPEIVNAELLRHSQKRYTHAASISKLINKLYKNCSRLEYCQSNGKDFLPILRSELKKFNKLHQHWMLTL